MKKLASVFAVTAVFAVFGSVLAFAQSSGNFSATGTGASCVIGAGGSFGTTGTTLTSFTANISTGSGNGTTLDIRPALVTGLFTQSKIDTTVSTASADVGIQVCVTVDDSGVGVLPASCVTYDQRFQQVSSQLFSQLTACTAVPTTIACSATLPCPAGDTCDLTAGFCTAPNLACNFDLILSTLSAHSFDFVVSVDNKKPHVVVASWKPVGITPGNNSGNSSTASCVGPGILTVTQTKVFNNSGILSFPTTN
jgi:hypothetical protein